jgi:hypothetical protein
MIIVLNFYELLAGHVVEQIEKLTKEDEVKVVNLIPYFDVRDDLIGQVKSQIEKVSEMVPGWRRENVLVQLPNNPIAAAVILAELEGQLGYLPAIVRLQPVKGAFPFRYEVAEVIHIEKIRASARKEQFEKEVGL